MVGAGPQAQPSATYGRNQPSTSQVPDTATQQAFISEVAPGAVAAQRRYGIPAAVTIAQAIDESGWGQSQLATADHNLFGIKGTGPAGTVVRPTEEYVDGSWVATTASFRVYHNVAESIADHSRLLATGESYQQAMANRQAPDAFANDLTGVYATDPNYGSNLIAHHAAVQPLPLRPHAVRRRGTDRGNHHSPGDHAGRGRGSPRERAGA